MKAVKTRDTVMTVFLVDPIIRFILPLVIRLRLSPNLITLVSFGVGIWCGLMLLEGRSQLAAVLFVAWYTIDCIDGKVARLTDRCTGFGLWLDVTTDRIGTCIVLLCAASHAHSGEDPVTAGLFVMLLLVWLVGSLNSDLLMKLAPSYTVESRAVGLDNSSPDQARAQSLRGRLNRLRLGRWIVQDIEFLTVAVALGPAAGLPREGAVLALTGMSAQKTIQTAGYWLRRRHELSSV